MLFVIGIITLIAGAYVGDRVAARWPGKRWANGICDVAIFVGLTLVATSILIVAWRVLP